MLTLLFISIYIGNMCTSLLSQLIVTIYICLRLPINLFLVEVTCIMLDPAPMEISRMTSSLPAKKVANVLKINAIEILILRKRHTDDIFVINIIEI